VQAIILYLVGNDRSFSLDRDSEALVGNLAEGDE
jgi:hypothetical protein